MVYQRIYSGGSGLGAGCYDLRGPEPVEYGRLIGGSYALEASPSEADSAITALGLDLAEIPFLGQPNENEEVTWWGGLQAIVEADDPNMFTTSVCLDDTVDESNPCARNLQISHAVEYATISPGGVVDASARCEQGMLVGGSCSVQTDSDRARVMRGGWDPADSSRWSCSWRSRDAVEEIAVAAQAFCLAETIPEECGCCSPLADVLAVKQQIQPLQPGTNRVRVSCDNGAPVLLGNCMLDGADSAALANVTMFSFGFPPGDTDTWGCSWNNPDAVPATAIVTALCLPQP